MEKAQESLAHSSVLSKAKRRYLGHHFRYSSPVLADSKLFSGFYNLLFISLFTLVLSYCVMNYLETGEFTRKIVYASITAKLDTLLLIFVGAIAITYLEFGVIVLFVWGLPLGICWILHALLCLLQLCGPVYMVVKVKLPPSQSAFCVIEALLMTMKMHSYFTVNWHLSMLRGYYEDHAEPGSESDDTDHNDDGPEFPDNVNIWDFTYFLLAPVLVYETRYPLVPRIRLGYVVERLVCMVILLASDWVILEGYILPILVEIPNKSFAEIYFPLVFPTMVFYLVTLFVTFEFILPLIAELTFFGDRFFYDDWWNASNMAEFSKKWNRPIYKFLVRHVFFSSVGRLPKSFAITMAFFVNCILDEVVLFAVFRKPSKWFLILLLLQVPSMVFAFLRRHAVKNVLFLLGLSFGLPFALLQHSREYLAEISTQ